jgi:filamentous hemagglutinin family protein
MAPTTEAATTIAAVGAVTMAPAAAASASALTTVFSAVSTVLDWVLNPSMNTGPGAPPADTPLGWTLLAVARRQLGQALGAQPQTVAQQTETAAPAQPLAAAPSQTETAAPPTEASVASVAAPAAAPTAAAAVVAKAAAATAPAPNSKPVGGHVVAGTATITTTASGVVITQKSQSAAVDFSSFDVGSQETVTFNQPSSAAVTLVRVTGTQATEIAGRITANGTVVLVDSHGIDVDTGATVNAGSMVLSTAGISTTNFMAGKFVFNQVGVKAAQITVDTTAFTVKQAGLAALIAPDVVVNGQITANHGSIDLIGARTATLDLSGDGLSPINITSKAGASAQPALITVTGKLIANAGSVTLTGAAANGVVQNIVDVEGTVQADTLGTLPGTIAVNGVGGNVLVDGTLVAQGATATTKGGSIAVTTTGNVVLGATARLNAAGGAGGGTIAVGTSLARAQGGPPVTGQPSAANVTVDTGARINASATSNGQGGTVAVVSSTDDNFAGTILAEGGLNGGNGGRVEVTANQVTDTGTITVAAPKGTLGTVAVAIAPVLSTKTGSVTATAGVPVTLDPTLTITEPGHVTGTQTISGAAVQVVMSDGGQVPVGESLTFTAPAASGITGTYDPANGTLVLSGTASAANYQTALRSVTYTDTTNPQTSFQSVGDVQVYDAEPVNNISNFAVFGVTTLPDAQAPTVTTTTGAVPYSSPGPAVLVDPGLIVADVESTKLTGATAAITSGFQSGDVLGFTAPTGSAITGYYNQSTGVLTLTGSASPATYQATLRTVTYAATQSDPSAAKTISFTVLWTVGSTVATKTVTVTTGSGFTGYWVYNTSTQQWTWVWVYP